jgi:hypothetical protein
MQKKLSYRSFKVFDQLKNIGIETFNKLTKCEINPLD